jgi:hypothetical protein
MGSGSIHDDTDAVWQIGVLRPGFCQAEMATLTFFAKLRAINCLASDKNRREALKLFLLAHAYKHVLPDEVRQEVANWAWLLRSLRPGDEEPISTIRPGCV